MDVIARRHIDSPHRRRAAYSAPTPAVRRRALRLERAASNRVADIDLFVVVDAAEQLQAPWAHRSTDHSLLLALRSIA